MTTPVPAPPSATALAQSWTRVLTEPEPDPRDLQAASESLADRQVRDELLYALCRGACIPRGITEDPYAIAVAAQVPAGRHVTALTRLALAHPTAACYTLLAHVEWSEGHPRALSHVVRALKIDEDYLLAGQILVLMGLGVTCATVWEARQS